MSLVEQARPDLFSVSVSGLAPKAAVAVKLTLYHRLGERAGRPIYSLPLPAERGKLQCEATIRAGLPIGDVVSRTHPILLTRPSPLEAHVSVARDVPSAPILELSYGLDSDQLRVGVLAHRPAPGSGGSNGDDRGYFMATVVPPRVPEAAMLTGREITFVVDSSGSMVDLPLELSREIVRRALSGLASGDRFNVMRFSTGAQLLWPEARSGTSDNVREAMAFLDALQASGDSEMHEAVRAYLEAPHDSAAVRIVCFLSDGMVGYEGRILEAVRDHGQDTRWFTFGVGTYVNKRLLEGLARAGRGAMILVPANGSTDVNEKVSSFVSMIGPPLLADVSIHVRGLDVEDVAPRRIADLRPGRPLTIMGRYRHPGRGVLELRGRSGATVEVPIELPAVQEEGSAIEVWWAKQRIDDLMTELANDPKPGLAAAITDLAFEHHLASAFTSFVAVEDDAAVAGEPRQLFTAPPPEYQDPHDNRRWLAAWGMVLQQRGDSVVVSAITSPATQREPIHLADQIVEVDGHPVRTLEDIEALIRKAAPGSVPVALRPSDSPGGPTSRIWLERP